MFYPEKHKLSAAQWCTSELPVCFGKPFSWWEQTCPCWTSVLSQSLCSWRQAAVSKQLPSACRPCMVLEKLWALWRKHVRVFSCLVIMLIFPITLVFLTQCLPAFPSSGARHCDTEGDKMLLSAQPRWRNLRGFFFPPANHSSSAGKTQATAPPCVLGSGYIQKSRYKSLKHHLGFCSWEADGAGKLRFWGKQWQGGGSKARNVDPAMTNSKMRKTREKRRKIGNIQGCVWQHRIHFIPHTLVK